MIHFLPDSFTSDNATPYDEAVARLASLRGALGVAEQAAGNRGPMPDPLPPSAWPEASAAKRRCFDARSIESAQAAAAGLEMLAAQRAAGTTPHPRSVATLADTIRAELTELGQLFSL